MNNLAQTYKKFDFDVEKLTLAESQKMTLSSCNSNGLFQMIERSYSLHLPLKISPDDILNTVVCLWSKYIITNAEKFRKDFVTHEGKKSLIYQSGGSYSEKRHNEFFKGLICLIKKDQENDNTSWLDKTFSQTTDEELLVRNGCLLASQKKYYEYHAILLCGIPSITLSGNQQDWQDLLQTIDKMTTFDDKMKVWKDDLCSLINEMTDGSEDFWQSCCTSKPYMSGGQPSYEGWIKHFNPFNEKGVWISGGVDKNEILNLTVDFNLNVNDNGREFKLLIECGPSGHHFENEILQVNNLFRSSIIN